MVTKGQVRDSIARLVGVWPALGKRDALRDEIGQAIMQHAERLEGDDLDAGVSMLIRNGRTRQDDGGPAQPPGPGEVVGCILTAYRDRTRGYVSAADRRGGMTFPEWWATVPEGEREQHRALYLMMTDPDTFYGLVNKARQHKANTDRIAMNRANARKRSRGARA